MAFRLGRNENMQACFRRLADRQLGLALEALGPHADAAFDAARTPLVRLHTLLYLFRPGLDQEATHA